MQDYISAKEGYTLTSTKNPHEHEDYNVNNLLEVSPYDRFFYEQGLIGLRFTHKNAGLVDHIRIERSKLSLPTSFL